MQHKVRSEEAVERQLLLAAKTRPESTRVFLADGDVLALSHRKLKTLFQKVKHYLPATRRISLYGSSRSIRTKGTDKISELRDLGLDRVYMGVESGSDTLLSKIHKGDTSAGMIEAGEIIRKAGPFLSVTILLGLGGKEFSHEHSTETARLLNTLRPHQIAVLTLMILPNTELGKETELGNFTPLESEEILKELYHLVSLLDVTCQFHANHASSYLPLQGRLPRDKQSLLNEISRGISGERPLVPEYWRAL